jgi:hypothetical protein
MGMARVHTAKKLTSARKKAVRKAAGERPPLEDLRAVMAPFADIEVAEPAVKPDAATMRAIRKAVRDYYQNPRALERT